LINGGGAISLLAFIPSIIDINGYEELVNAAFISLIIFSCGLFFAVVHNRFRRLCSLKYEQHGMRPPKGKIFGASLTQPTVCSISVFLLWLSILAFLSACLYVAIIGILVVDSV
jgi:hypothetical protein